MAGQTPPDTEDKPLDPAVERVRRKLVRFLAINIGLLFAAVMAVVLAIVYQSRTAGDAPAAAVQDDGSVLAGEIALPAGARLVSHSLDGGRIALEIEEAGGAGAILLYDMAAGRIVGRFAIVGE